MKSLVKFTVLLVLCGITQCQSSSHPSKWSEPKLNEWFESEQYLNGLQIFPDPSTDRRTFAVHYYDHKELWDKAFALMKNTDFAIRPLGRTELGDSMYVTVSEYFPKIREQTLFEAHQTYIDVHYIVSGREAIDVAPLKDMTVTQPYNAENDIMFGTVPAFSELKSSPDRLFIIFPSDAHRPSIIVNNDSTLIRKIVVKIPVK